MTPIKANAMVRKNMSTTRSQYGNSPSATLKSAVEYQDPGNPSALYYQIVNNLHQPPRMMSQTYRASTQSHQNNNNNNYDDDT